MTQEQKAGAFAALHTPGAPVILFNAWDPGSAKAVAEGGAKAIATGSWSVAAAFGYSDAEALPMELALANAERIVDTVELPVTWILRAAMPSIPRMSPPISPARWRREWSAATSRTRSWGVKAFIRSPSRQGGSRRCAAPPQVQVCQRSSTRGRTSS